MFDEYLMLMIIVLADLVLEIECSLFVGMVEDMVFMDIGMFKCGCFEVGNVVGDVDIGIFGFGDVCL